MEKEELMIGNFIEVDGNIISVGIIYDNQISWNIAKYPNHRIWNPYISLSDKRVKPIPLTEEWLLKFGFKHYSTYKIFELENYFRYSLEKKYTQIELGDGKFARWMNWGEMKYVNQLQNLYFVLTGEKLSLKI